MQRLEIYRGQNIKFEALTPKMRVFQAMYACIKYINEGKNTLSNSGEEAEMIH